MKLVTLILLSTAFFISTTSVAFARGRGGGGSGGNAFEFGIGFLNSSQDKINSWIDSLGTAGTKNLNSGYEFAVDYQYKFSGTMFALKFRPSYVTQTASGGGVEASLKGFTFFPLLKMVPLENSFMKFFLQGGVGYGSLTGQLSSSTGSVDFSGGEFGAQVGLGSDFCFTDTHCLTLEANFRYLPMARNVTTGRSGTLTGLQTTGELEYQNEDVATTLSGLQGMLAYTLNF